MERAIDICLCSQLFDALKAIAEDLDEAADPALLARCGSFVKFVISIPPTNL